MPEIIGNSGIGVNLAIFGTDSLFALFGKIEIAGLGHHFDTIVKCLSFGITDTVGTIVKIGKASAETLKIIRKIHPKRHNRKIRENRYLRHNRNPLIKLFVSRNNCKHTMQKREVKWNSENFTGSNSTATGDSHGRQPRATATGGGAGRRGRATGPGDGEGRQTRETDTGDRHGRQPRATATGDSHGRQPRATATGDGAGLSGPIVTIDKTVADSFAGQFVSKRRIGKSVIPHRIVRIDVNVTLDTIATLHVFGNDVKAGNKRTIATRCTIDTFDTNPIDVIHDTTPSIV